MEWSVQSSPCPVDNYTIEYRLTNKDQCEPTNDAPRMTGLTVSTLTTTVIGLLSYSTYEVFVRAVNVYGEGPEASMEVTTATLEG